MKHYILSVIFLLGLLTPGMSLCQEDFVPHSILCQICSLRVGVTDVYGEPFWDIETMIAKGCDKEKEEILLEKMIADIRFTAKEMRKQMDDQPVKGGRFDGNTLFESMENSTTEDVYDFFRYIRARPVKYQDHDWKISEIYATWIDSETPLPINDADALIDSIFSSVKKGREEMKENAEERDLFVNLKKGTLNKLKPTTPFEMVKEELPFFTGETEEGAEFNCGGGVFFVSYDFYFYTHRDYIEIRKKFPGKTSKLVLGKTIEEVSGIFKKQVHHISRDTWDGKAEVYYYKRKYGTLVLVFEGSDMTCSKIQMHSRKYDEIESCW